MHSNLATAQEIYACFGQGDIPGILDKIADDVRWEDWTDNHAQKTGVPWLQAKHGKAGVLEFFQYLGGNMQIRDFQVLSMMEGGNQVAVEFIIEADIPATGGHFRDEEMHLWTFNEAGKVMRLRHYTDTYKHAKAAGLA